MSRRKKFIQGWLNALLDAGGIINLTAPIISPRGDALAGRYIYIENRGTWLGSWLLYSYQWQKNGVDISGETGTTYLIRYADEGANITVVETVFTGKTSTSNTIAIEVLWSQSFVIDVVVPTLGVTLTGGKVSGLSGLKSVLTFSQGTDANRPTIVQFYGGNAFKTGSGSIRLTSAGAYPQNSVYFMAGFYGSNGELMCNKTSSGFLNASVNANLIKWRNAGGDVLNGTRTLTSFSGFHTGYWEFNYNTGFAVGNDGTTDSSNSTAIASAPSGTFNILNAASGANAIQSHVGVMVWFTRALTTQELSTFNEKIKAYRYYGYSGQLPFEGGQDGIANVVLSAIDVKDWNLNSSTSTVNSYYDPSKTVTKNAQVHRLENPQRQQISTSIAYETEWSIFISATSIGMTRSITQTQSFSVFGMVTILPYYEPGVTTNRIFHYLNGSDLIVLYVDRTTNSIKMQSQGSIGTSGISNANFQNFKTVIYYALFNNTSSVLTIDIDGTEYEVTGSLGGSTGLAGSVEFGEDLSGIMTVPIFYNGTPTATEKNNILDFLRSKRNFLNDYSRGTFIGNASGVFDSGFTNHDAFGGWCKKSNVKYVVFRRGATHNSNDGDLILTTSSSNYQTLTTILDTSVVYGSFDARDPRISKLSSGRLIINFFLNPYPSQAYTMYSDDNGVTWSNAVVVDSGAAYYDIRCSGPIIQLPNGDLLNCTHVEDNGGLNLKLIFWRSTNQGSSWSYDSEIVDPNPGVATDFEEGNMTLLANGQIFLAIRYEEGTSNKCILKSFGTVSGSNPISWSSVTTSTRVMNLGDAYGSPGNIQTSTGRIILTCRLNSYQGPGGLWYSDDNGVTFTQGKFPEPHADYWVYGSPIENDDGTLEILFFQQTQIKPVFDAGPNTGKSFGKVVPLINYT